MSDILLFLFSTLTNRCIPFFVYAVDHVPFDDKDLAELEQLKEKLPLAAVLFVKVEVNLDSHDDDFSSLHGAERVNTLKNCF